MGLEPGARLINNRDRWKDRTYGMHVIHNYFPNRELGVCFYYLADYTNAVRYLTRSLEQEPSGRAKYYLNLSRKQLLRGQPASTVHISIEQPAEQPQWTNQREVTLRGSAKSANYISALQIDHGPKFIELAEETILFEQTLQLQAGHNAFVLNAEDLKGTTTSKIVQWIADYIAPQITIMHQEHLADATIYSGFCSDNEALDRVLMDGTLLYMSSGRDNQHYVPFVFTNAHTHLLSVSAFDKAGNRTTCALNNGDAETASRITQGPIHLLASTDPTLQLPKNSEDKLPPHLNLSIPHEILTINNHSFYLEGEAVDNGGLMSISVNGEEWMNTNDIGAVRIRFGRFLQVEESNTYTTVIKDKAGNTTQKSFSVIYHEPEYLKETYRLRTALLPLYDSQQKGMFSAQQIGLMINQQLADPPVRFRILARGDELQHILMELKINQSDLIDLRTALKTQQLLPADLLLTGSLFSDGNGMTIYLQVIDVNTQSIIYQSDVYTESTLDNTRYQIAGLISKIEQYFPLVKGQITDVHSNIATLDIGTHLGIREGTKLLLLNSDTNRALSAYGDVLLKDNIPIELIVSDSVSDRSKATIYPNNAHTMVKSGDNVYTR